MGAAHDNTEAKGEARLLGRDCAALSVPWGKAETLAAGSLTTVTQRLGGAITVLCDGNLYRIAEADADALGLEPRSQTAVPPAAENGNYSAEAVEAAAWAQMGSCYDPEIPIDIVELGLVYACTATPLDNGRYRVAVRMTLTAPGCGMGDVLANEVNDKLLAIPGVDEAEVELVWEPRWNREMMSEAARLETGLL